MPLVDLDDPCELVYYSLLDWTWAMFQGDEYLSVLSDMMLGQVQREREAPHYCDEVFRRKERLAQTREAALPMPKVPEPGDEMLRRECAEVIALANLTPAQKEVFLLHFEGHGWEAIGAMRGHSKQGAHRIFKSAAAKLRKTWSNYWYRGLSEVYRSEIRRHKKPRRH